MESYKSNQHNEQQNQQFNVDMIWAFAKAVSELPPERINEPLIKIIAKETNKQAKRLNLYSEM